MISLSIHPARVSRFGRGAAVAVVGGSAAAALYGWSLDLAGVPLRAGGPGASTAQRVGPTTVASGTAFLTLIAIGLAAFLQRRARRPRRTFVIVTAALTGLSLALPFAAGATATSTKVWFAVGHVLLAALIVPILASALPGHVTRRQSPRSPRSVSPSVRDAR